MRDCGGFFKFALSELGFFRVQFQERPDPFSEEHGLIYRSFVQLFDRLRDQTECTYVIKASFLEIYNEKVIE